MHLAIGLGDRARGLPRDFQHVVEDPRSRRRRLSIGEAVLVGETWTLA